MVPGGQSLVLNFPADFAKPGLNGAGYLRLHVGTWTSPAIYADFAP